jgi:hypothetical protein
MRSNRVQDKSYINDENQGDSRVYPFENINNSRRNPQKNSTLRRIATAVNSASNSFMSSLPRFSRRNKVENLYNLSGGNKNKYTKKYKKQKNTQKTNKQKHTKKQNLKK